MALISINKSYKNIFEMKINSSAGSFQYRTGR